MVCNSSDISAGLDWSKMIYDPSFLTRCPAALTFRSMDGRGNEAEEYRLKPFSSSIMATVNAPVTRYSVYTNTMPLQLRISRKRFSYLGEYVDSVLLENMLLPLGWLNGGAFVRDVNNAWNA